MLTYSLSRVLHENLDKKANCLIWRYVLKSLINIYFFSGKRSGKFFLSTVLENEEQETITLKALPSSLFVFCLQSLVKHFQIIMFDYRPSIFRLQLITYNWAEPVSLLKLPVVS